MKNWVNRCRALLDATLVPPQSELNDLDWKLTISDASARLTEHLIAFANYSKGGFLIFGVDSSGLPVGVDTAQAQQIVHRVADLARTAIEPPLAIDHCTEQVSGESLLFIHIDEAISKPVTKRGGRMEETFVRSGGTTRKASRAELASLLLNSRNPRWETLRATMYLSNEEILVSLDPQPILGLLNRAVPTTASTMVEWLSDEGFVLPEDTEGGYITNLGAIAAAADLGKFVDVSRKAVRLIRYKGKDKQQAIFERTGAKGYAIRFEALLQYALKELGQVEILEGGLRLMKYLYPQEAVREIIANALIHQDFTVPGAGPLIEIFDDRLEVSSPGALLPSKQLDRLIGTQPESRNELLASAFRRYRICEERGSGLVKAAIAVERDGLPPIRFESPPGWVKVTLFGYKPFAEMNQEDRVSACYQHSILCYLSSESMTNASFRARLRLPENARPSVSLVIQEALERHLIKTSDPQNRSRKLAKYVPYWA